MAVTKANKDQINGVSVSAGAGDAGKPVIANSSGFVDPTFGVVSNNNAIAYAIALGG